MLGQLAPGIVASGTKQILGGLLSSSLRKRWTGCLVFKVLHSVLQTSQSDKYSDSLESIADVLTGTSAQLRLYKKSSNITW